MSLWQFHACVDGYNKAHDPKAEKALTSHEEEALWQWMNS